MTSHGDPFSSSSTTSKLDSLGCEANFLLQLAAPLHSTHSACQERKVTVLQTQSLIMTRMIHWWVAGFGLPMPARPGEQVTSHGDAFSSSSTTSKLDSLGCEANFLLQLAAPLHSTHSACQERKVTVLQTQSLIIYIYIYIY